MTVKSSDDAKKVVFPIEVICWNHGTKGKNLTVTDFVDVEFKESSDMDAGAPSFTSVFVVCPSCGLPAYFTYPLSGELLDMKDA